jgi:hypothetical protein
MERAYPEEGEEYLPAEALFGGKLLSPLPNEDILLLFTLKFDDPGTCCRGDG